MSAPAREVEITELVGPVTDCYWILTALYEGAPNHPLPKYREPLPRGGVIINQGGTYSSKTFTNNQFAIEKMMLVPETVVVVAGQSIRHLKKDAYKDFLRIRRSSAYLRWFFPESGWNKTDRKFTAQNGSSIEFDSYDFEKAHGTKQHILIVDEANAMPLNVFKELRRRTEWFTIVSYNPSSTFWAHGMISMPDVRFVRTTYKHNKFCPPAKVAEIESWEETDPMDYRVYGEGKTGQVEGLVYRFHIGQLPPDAELQGYGVDFGHGIGHPMAVAAIYTHGNRLWVKDVLHECGLITSIACEKMNERGMRHDLPIVADSARPDLIKEYGSVKPPLKSYFMEPCRKGAGSVDTGITMVKEWEIWIDADSPGAIDDFSHYEWEKDASGNPTGKPRKKFDDVPDAVRYFVADRLARGARTTRSLKSGPDHKHNVYA